MEQKGGSNMVSNWESTLKLKGSGLGISVVSQFDFRNLLIAHLPVADDYTFDGQHFLVDVDQGAKATTLARRLRTIGLTIKKISVILFFHLK